MKGAFLAHASSLPLSIVSLWITHCPPGLASSRHPLIWKQSPRKFVSPKSIFSSKYSTSCNRRAARNIKGISELPLIQLIFPYKTSCVRSSLEIPLKSLRAAPPGGCRRQERNSGSGFKWFFSSLFLVRVLQFAPSGRSCTVQCFWLGPNSEFLTNWMNEFLVDQNYHPSREHMTGENPEYFAIQMQYIRIAYRWINSKFHTPTPLNSTGSFLCMVQKLLPNAPKIWV